MRLSVAILLICAAVASAASVRFSSDDEWQQFKITFKKDYGAPDKDSMRREVFEENLRKIRNHNYQADLGRKSYRLGVNEYADLTSAEYRKLMLGLRPSKKRSFTGSTFLPPNNVNLPKEVDWRKHGYVTKVKNQGQCGSCWAFSSTGSLEGQHFRKTGKLVSLSEQQLVDCGKKTGNEGCNGGLMDLAFKYIRMNGGIDTEKSYPYTAENGVCHFKKADVGATDNGFVDVGHNEKDLKIAVATVGPVSVAIDASQASFQFYKSGVYNEPKCSPTSLDHGVLVVGYGTTSGDKPEDYWIVKNSWGPSWGMHGYILMRRNNNNMCGIATMASYPLV